MHQPRSFKMKDTQAMYEIINKHPLATIISCTEEGPVANHLPLILIERNKKAYLQGHAIKNNDLGKNPSVLSVFQGPDAYISPSWYPSKKIEGKEVPTWNYVVVHVRGQLKFYNDESWLLTHLKKLSEVNESSFENPWHLSDAPQDYIQRMLSAIVGIEIEIKSMHGKIKMSQNHPLENRQGVIQGLTQIGRQDVARLVENPTLF